ncbi:MAG: hypothetical protein AAFR28_00095 [Pseudomonadota bacterium]
MSPLIIAGIIVSLLLLAAATWKAPRLTSSIIWALTATVFVCSALLMHAPGPFSQKALWITIAVPVIWVAFQFWTYWDGNKWRPAFGLLALSLIAGVVVFLSEPLA